MKSLKVWDTKINVQKSISFLCSNNNLSEKEFKIFSFTMALKTIKYSGINLTKEVKDLYIEHYKTSMKKIEHENGKVSLFMD